MEVVGILGNFVLSSSNQATRRGVFLGRRSTKVHVALYRWSRGRLGARLPGWPRARILLLDHLGAKSGIRRTSPVMFHPDGDAVAVAASKGGQPVHPAWFHNLLAHPDTTIQIGSQVRPVRARLADDAERARLWPEFVALFPGFDSYRRQAEQRTIPIVLLEPR